MPSNTTLTGTYTLGVTLSVASTTIANTATVANYGVGIAVYGPTGTAWTLTNYGSVAGGGTSSGDSGVQLQSGGYVANALGGSISGADGVLIYNAPATVTNAGVIGGTGTASNSAGVRLTGGGYVSNAAGGVISGYQGVNVYGGSGTVINAGTISGSSMALSFGASGDLLVVDPDAVFQGAVSAAGTGNVLELASGGSVGTISGIGGSYSGFDTITLDTGAAWDITGSLSGETISGFAVGDTLDADLVADSGTVTAGVLNLYDSGSPVGSITVGSGFYTGDFYFTPDGFGGTNIQLDVVRGTITNGLTLTLPSTTIAGTGLVENLYGSYGVTGPAGPFWTLTNYGSIAGGSQAAVYLADGLLINEAGASITAAYNGFQSDPGTVINYGVLTGTAGYGVSFSGDGSVTNATYASITGGISGVLIQGAGTAYNAGAIYGGSQDGILFNGGGSVTNAATGTITGYRTGVYIGGNYGVVINSGGITAASGSGVFLDDGGSVTNEALATIVGGYAGVYFTGAIGEAGTLVNYGGITGTAAFGVYLSVSNSSVTNAAYAVITGVYGGVYFRDSLGTLFNYGDITATGGSRGANGVYMAQGGLVSNGGTGTITGADTGIRITDQYGTVVNYGGITGNTGSGIYLYANGSVTNGNTGNVYGGTDGVYFYNSATLTNAGYITGGNRDGVRVGEAGSVSNATSARISGASNGVFFLYGAGTVANYGTIDGYARSGVSLAGGGSVTNGSSGLISGGSYGVSAYNAPATVLNSGTITGYLAGVELLSGGGVTNQSGGTITGYESGVELGTGATLTNQSGGTISGYFGVSGYSYATLTNYGTISGYGTVSASGTFSAPGTYGGVGIAFSDQSTATNQVGGLITGYRGIEGVYNTTVVNYGSIQGNSAYYHGGGAGLLLGSSLTNQSSGTITGYYGVYGNFGVSVVNAGLIEGNDTLPLGTGVVLRNGYGLTNQTGGTISGYRGISVAAYSTGTYSSAPNVNYGAIYGNTTASHGVGVRMVSYYGLGFTNQSGGTITGYTGVEAYRYGVSVVNAGTIGATGADGAGVSLVSGASVTNQTGGTISGYYGVNAGYTPPIPGGSGPVSVVNAGSIIGSTTDGAGVRIQTYGYVTNQYGGTISGAYGIVGGNHGAVTVINAGGISGVTDAVTFASGYADLVVIDPGAEFTGTVDGGNAVGGGAISTLELATGASAGTLSGLGTQYLDFAQITVDAGATWALNGDNTIAAGVTLTDSGTLTGSGSLENDGLIVTDPSSIIYDGSVTGTGTIDIGAGSDVTLNSGVAITQSTDFTDNTGSLTLGDWADFAGTIGAFVRGDTIVLSGVTDADNAGLVNDNTLEVTRTGNPPIDLTLNPSDDFTGMLFHVTESGSDAIVTVACFAEGTRIETPDGMIAVETLRIGDRVRTAGGAVRSVRWIGFRRIDLTRHPRPELAQPIRIAADAFAVGVPTRDLLLSPDHAVLLDGVLVPIRLLRNDASIRREMGCRAVTYFHVELDAHDILLAEGLAAESYLDTGNRGMFENAGLPRLLHPTFDNDQTRRETESCVLLVTDPARVEPLWQRLAARAGALNFCLPAEFEMTDEPALLIAAGERILKPVTSGVGHYTFLLPAGSRHVRLLSRSATLSDQRPWVEDRRELGVMVRRLTLHAGGSVTPIPLDHPALIEGWWDVESDRHGMCRWTNGDALLWCGGEGPVIIDIELAGALHYPIERAPAIARRQTRVG